MDRHNNKPLVPRYSNYEDLLCFKKTRVIYDMTYHFCSRFVPIASRTNDQMIQAARSSKQNIIEGCVDTATSSHSGLMLLNVSRGSLHELLEDYCDYIRVHGGEQWQSDSKECRAMQKLGREHDDPRYFVELAESRNDITIANMVIVLIKQADILLYKLIESLSKKFADEGGFKERMHAVRTQNRGY